MKYVHLLQSYHSYFQKPQFFRSVLTNVSKCQEVYASITDLGVKREGGPGGFWLRMYLPILSLLWATRDLDSLWPLSARYST